MKNMCLIQLLILSFVVIVTSQNYTLYETSQQNGAACLDGSPHALYINEGSGQNKNSFIVYFQGGGYCGDGNLSATLQSCYKRSKTELGTSTVLLRSRSFDPYGILSTDNTINPNFYDWTKVIVNYCDGAEYFGSRPEPIPYKDKKLYFRGTDNVLETVRYLQQRYDIFNKDRIIVSGKSAGGVATYLYADLFYEKAINAKVIAVPDSGLFLTDYYSPIVQTKVIRQVSQALIDIVWGTQRYPLEDCFEEWQDDVLQCFNAANLVKYRKTPMLALQSAYDQWSIDNLLMARCLTNDRAPFSLQNCNQTYLEVIEDYRDVVRKSMVQMLKEKSNLGIWSPSCVQHGFINGGSFHDANYRVPSSFGKQVNDVLLQFLVNPQKPPIYIDWVNWPQNRGCNGVNKMVNLREEWEKLLMD